MQDIKKTRKGVYKSVQQNETLSDINNLCNVREGVIQMCNVYTIISSEATYKALKGNISTQTNT